MADRASSLLPENRLRGWLSGLAAAIFLPLIGHVVVGLFLFQFMLGSIAAVISGTTSVFFDHHQDLLSAFWFVSLLPLALYANVFVYYFAGFRFGFHTSRGSREDLAFAAIAFLAVAVLGRLVGPLIIPKEVGAGWLSSPPKGLLGVAMGFLLAGVPLVFLTGGAGSGRKCKDRGKLRWAKILDRFGVPVFFPLLALALVGLASAYSATNTYGSPGATIRTAAGDLAFSSGWKESDAGGKQVVRGDSWRHFQSITVFEGLEGKEDALDVLDDTVADVKETTKGNLFVSGKSLPFQLITTGSLWPDEFVKQPRTKIVFLSLPEGGTIMYEAWENDFDMGFLKALIARRPSPETH